jgi:abortive infection bacteriophage resistance protein
MRYNKQPISINDQIAILKGRGLIFSDEQKAQTVLENIITQDFGMLISRWFQGQMNG